MKLKYFLRGLGTGILFSVLVLGISNKISPATVSDSEIIRRAKELGMVKKEEDIDENLNRIIDDQEEGKEKEDSKETGDAKENPLEKEETEQNSDQNKDTKDDAAEGEKENDARGDTTPESILPEPASEEEEQVVFNITISPGMSSAQVAKAMEEIGLIEDAEDFAAYLADNGHSKRVQAGTYKIEGKLDYEEIAKKITK